MHFRSSHIAVALIASILSAGLATAQSDSPLDTLKEKASYSIGIEFGSVLKLSKDDVNFDTVIRGMKDAMEDAELAIDDETRAAAMKEFQENMQKKQLAVQQEAGNKFFDTKLQEDGVVALPSGLLYKVIRKGSGAKPKATDTVETHYRGTFVNGQSFDSSYDRGQPAQFPVNRVIAGWTEALQLMQEGAKWELYIPYNLAYGEQGRAGIPPYSTLIFEIELLRIVK